MTDFKIINVEKRGPYFVAQVQSYRDQQVYELHDRWGSWMVGDHTQKSAPMREAAAISRNLAPALQAEKAQVEARIKKLAEDNPFLATNPFMALT